MQCHLYNVYMWSLTVLGLLAAATIFNVLGMVGLSLIVIYSGAYNKFKTIQTPVGRGGNDGKGKKVSMYVGLVNNSNSHTRCHSVSSKRVVQSQTCSLH